MCECGCGDFRPYKSFLVGDLVLSVEVYPGCQECGTGIMVALNIFTMEEAARWIEDIEALPQLQPVKGDYGWKREDVPLIGEEDIVEWAEKQRVLLGEEGSYSTLEDYLADNGLDLLQGGLEIRLKKNRDAENKNR
jgi:hypothetical protein